MVTGAFIQQFYDKNLSHSSYAIVSGGEVILIDPARDPHPYYDFARLHNARITGVIETHPHADFVSSHLEIHRQTGAVIYASRLTHASYPHVGFDEGDDIVTGTVTLRAINTPGHSPDSICILLIEEGLVKAVFTGDTLFAGDVGRPDLRENGVDTGTQKEELAKALYHSTRNKLMTLPAAAKVYPSHGPGSLCGKHLSPELSSTIGHEMNHNYALEPMTEEHFVQLITADQPFIPKYFSFDVALNKTGVEGIGESLAKIKQVNVDDILPDVLIIDTRTAVNYRFSHLANSINIPQGNSFETWLGTVTAPEESFYLLAESAEAATEMLSRTAKIGYEKQVTGLVIADHPGTISNAGFNPEQLKSAPDDYTVIDLRNENEVAQEPIFANALSFPLPSLREDLEKIPRNKSIAVHCAGGYRSAIGSSIIARKYPEIAVYDLGEAISQFK